MMTTSGFKLMEYDISKYDELKPVIEPKQERKSQIAAPVTPVVDWQIDEKLKALKRWANTTIQSDLRPKLTSLQNQIDKVDSDGVTKLAAIMKLLKPEMEKARPLVPAYDVPKPSLDVNANKVDMMRNVVRTGFIELGMLLRGVQDTMNKSSQNKEVVGFVQVVKSFKVVLDKA